MPVALAAAALAPAATQAAKPSVTLAVLPAATEPADLTGVEGAALGLLSAGIGTVPTPQTFLDMSQGARTNPSLYEGEAPVLFATGRRGIAPGPWRRARRRAARAPADLVPGLLGETLAGAGIPARATSELGPAAAIAADADGRVPTGGPCPGCPGLTVTSASVAEAARLALRLGPRDLLIAFERPPAERNRQLALAVAGLGEGLVHSPSTRMDGYALATDLAPTILERFAIEPPEEMSGQPLEVVPHPEPAVAAQELEDRLAAVSPRRGEAIGLTLTAWAAVALLGALAGRGPPALALLALSVVLLPAALLATAALTPSAGVEWAIAALAPPATAALLLRLAPGWPALALACGVTTLAHCADLLAGSPLTARSLAGPNPALGVRFYGIGNELEAVLACTVLIGTGAALAAWRPAASPRALALGFGAAALAAVAVLAPGAFGADVGAAIAIPAGTAVAVAVVLRARRGLALALLIAVPAALALLMALDLALGGDAHLSRSVLEAGGLDDVAQVAERRLRLCAQSFARYGDSPALWAAVALIAAAIAGRRTVASWFAGSRAALAGLLGAGAATVAGTLANDSGALLLMVGTAITSLAAGYAWSLRAGRSAGSSAAAPST